MSVLTCKMCGGDLELSEGMTTARCPYCGTSQTIPRLDSEQRIRLYERANHFRRRNDYDMAMALYEQLLHEDQTDSEAYWSLVLCRYGIKYVEDSASHRRIPTVNRTQYTSILADEDYKEALRYADAMQAKLYEQEAAQIDAIQKGILQVSQNESPYDIFLCYKETDENGQRTRDSVLADEVYYHLTKEGYRVFFSRITLQDKLGESYEPYIFAGLHSAKIMIVIGTDPQNLQSAWVKNEWSRYLALIQKGEAKVLIPAYRDMDPYDLPKEFSHLQALNMAQLGFMQDLLHGVGKIIGSAANTTIPAGNVPASNRAAPPPPLAEAERIAYQPADPVRERKTGWEPYGWKRGVVCGIALVVFITLFNAKGLYKRIKMNQEEKAAQTSQAETTKSTSPSAELIADSDDSDKMQAGEEPVFEGILAEFLSRVYKVPAKEVTKSQLAKIQQLTIDREYDLWHIGYSYEAPGPPVFPVTEDGELFTFGSEGLTWVDFSSDSALTLDGLSMFTGLQKLDVCSVLTAEDITGLPLVSVNAYFDNPAQAASVLEHPEAIKELGFHAGAENLEGIHQFEKLETLYLDSSELKDIDTLVNLQHLKHLTICADETLTDFAVIGKLSELETLRLDTGGLKSIDFISQLSHLRQLEITNCPIRALYGLENCIALETLSVTNCMELKNLSTLEALTGLRELALAVPYNCPAPNLSRLTSLQKLYLLYADDCSFIENLTELTELRLEGCTLPETFDASKLTSLKTLSFTCQSYFMELSAIEKLQSLERLELQGTETYEDLSKIFNMPNLRELNLSDIQCEIDFDAVSQNPTLEILCMNHVTLYKNVEINGSDGFYTIDYDDVALEDHLDFFSRFPSLKELFLRENGLTDLSFAEQIPTLEVLDISNNYITRLSPLTGLPSLRKVICGDNPLESTEGLGDNVVIINQSQTDETSY